MQWTREQDLALKKISDWYHNSSQQVFRVFGYAGTGKTTIAKTIADDIDGLVLYMAFTGKAAYVLRSKGCTNATTIHSKIYKSREKSKQKLIELEIELKVLLETLLEDDTKIVSIKKQIEFEKNALKKPFFILNEESEVQDADLIIVDEVSMVDNIIGNDLCSFGTKILVLGDPAQLPPIAGLGFFTHNIKPDVMLTDIQRQAKDNPIIRMATDVRNEKWLSLGDYGNGCSVITGDIDTEIPMKSDQILVGKNVTRININNRIRQLKGIIDPYPVQGDRLVCLKNHHEVGLLNGALFYVEERNAILENKVHLDIRQEDSDLIQEILTHEHYFLGQGDKLAWYEKKEAEEFDYGYALTVHKAQGSQWDNVLLFDESSSFKDDKWRWLYTGITRAAKTITIKRN